MTIGQFSLADPSLSQVGTTETVKKSPPKRTATALSDRKLVPEPR